MDRRQRRIGESPLRQVIHADHGNIVRHPVAATIEPIYRAPSTQRDKAPCDPAYAYFTPESRCASIV
jgi:hypothetical protein